MATSRLLICFALREEAAPFLRTLSLRRAQNVLPACAASESRGPASIPLWCGSVASAEIVVALTGIGPAAAARAAQALVRRSEPAAVLSSGFAGALRPDLRRGDIIVPELVTDQADTFSCDVSLLPPHGSSGLKLVSVNRILVTAGDKHALRQRTGAAAADMESAAIARVCRERKIAFAVARVISDEAAEDLPADFNLLFGKNQQPNLAKSTAYFLCHPLRLLATLAMRRRWNDCAERMAKFLRQSVARS